MINEERFLKRFCINFKQVKNYAIALNDEESRWVLHHIAGENRSYKELIKEGLYYNREDPSEFIFVPISKTSSKKYNVPTHNTLHKKNVSFSEDHKNKISEAQKGKKRAPLSKETRTKIGNSQRGRKKNLQPKTEFGIKYYEHYGYSKNKNIKQYQREQYYYNKYHKFSWEA